MRRSLVLSDTTGADNCPSTAFDFGKIFERMHGVIFPGTPHRGSDVAYWTVVAARFLHTAQLSTRTDTELLGAFE